MYKDREEIAWAVDEEGLDYFLLNYSSADEMPDEEMREAFETARTALNRFCTLLPELYCDD